MDDRKRQKNQSDGDAIKPQRCQKINKSSMWETTPVERKKNEATNGHHQKDDGQSSKELFDGTERVAKYCHV